MNYIPYCSISFIIMLFVPISIYASPLCGDLNVSYGPYDYTNPYHKEKFLPIVESAHFTKNIENLNPTRTDGRRLHLGGEIAYTLRAFPNHHRALLALSKLAIRDKKHTFKGSRYSVLCYFDRAVRFKPNDPIVYTLFANHLQKLGKIKLAQQKLGVAEKLDPENANIKYNLGLLYFKTKKYDIAMSYAKEAYGLGFPLPGLRNKLKRVGKWTN